MRCRKIKPTLSTTIISEPFYCSCHFSLIKFCTTSDIGNFLSSSVDSLSLEYISIAYLFENIKLDFFEGKTKFRSKIT